MTAEDWKAETYHRVSVPQQSWGEKVLASLELRGDETVMDAGCGSGRMSARLLERLPNGHVVALDASPAMLEVARRELSRFGERVSFVRAELARDELPSGMDVVFSTATFHWVHDHDALFHSIARALVPGGRLHAQCGGEGNLARAHREILEIAHGPTFVGNFSNLGDPWVFASIAETERRLSAAGFIDLDVSLEDAPTPFANRDSYREFVGSVVLRPFLAHLPKELHPAFVEAVTDRAHPDYTLDYVRLNLRGKMPSS